MMARRAMMGASQTGGGGGTPTNGLLTNLVAYWALNETSGTRLDSHGSNDLTDNNTVGSATGKQGNAASFVKANTEYLSVASNSNLQTGDIDFTVALWYYHTVNTGYRYLIGKYGTSTGREWLISNNASGCSLFYSSDGTFGGQTTLAASNFGALTINNWYFLVIYHDSVNNEIGIGVNGTFNTQAYAGGLTAGTAPFEIGRYVGDAGGYLDGRIDEAGFWKRVLDSTDLTFLYNSGTGRAYGEFD